MQSTLTLTLDLDSKIGTLTDATNYSILGLNPVTYGVKGIGNIKFNGQIIASGNYAAPLIDLPTTTYQFNLELDVNGEVANGIYTVEYTAQAQYTDDCSSNGVSVFLDNPNYNATLFSNPENIYLSVAGIGAYNFGSVISAANSFGNLQLTVSGFVPFLGSSPRLITLGFRTDAQAFVYSGCEKITQDIGFTYDCDTDPTGSWNVYSNTPTPSGVIVGQATGTIEWPSWTGEPTITISSLPYSNTALATGTYGATISQVVTQEIQASPLLEITYTLENTYEWKVTCAGSLCDMNACIESLRSAHESELLKNKISKYQPYIDNVAIYLHEAYNYKSCGEFDKYRETLAKVKATLDASGCDCRCCDDNEYKWVAVSPATSTFLNSIMSEIQFRVGSSKPALTTQPTGKGLETGAIWHDTSNDNLYKATVTGASITWALYYDPSLTSITTATNGLFETPPGTVKLGGNLTATTTIGLQSFDLIFDGTSGEVYAKRDGGANSVAYPFVVVGQSSGTTSGAGSGIIFQTQDGLNAGISLGYTEYLWENYTSQNSQFRIYAKNSGTLDWKFLVQSDGQLKAKEYGAGNFENNNPAYFLGVDSSNAFVEIDPLQVGATASNGLTKTSGDIKLGGTLTADTQVGLTTYDLNFYSNTGIIQLSKNQIGAPAYTRVIQVKSVKNGVAFVQGQGAAIDFSVGASNTNTPIGTIGTAWDVVGTSSNMSFDVYTPGGFVITKFKINGADGSLEAGGYGSGNITGTPTKMLAVDSSGVIIEETVSNGLTLSGSTLKLGGALTGATTITTTNINTLALAGLQPGTAASFVAIDGSNNLITATPSVGSSKLFVAKISQSGVADPVNATIVLNSGALTVTWKYDSPGEYTATIGNAGLNPTAFISFMPDITSSSNPVYIVATLINTTQYKVRAYRLSTGTPANMNQNDYINNAIMKIEVY